MALQKSQLGVEWCTSFSHSGLSFMTTTPTFQLISKNGSDGHYSSSEAATIVQCKRSSSIFVLGPGNFELIYGPDVVREILELTNVVAPPQTRESFEELGNLQEDIELVFTGWGAPYFTSQLLNRMPRLKAVFHGAGSIRPFVSDEFWRRGVVITNARQANAIPVAQYTVSVILLSLKHFWSFSRQARAGEGWGDQHRVMPGAFNSTVGLVSCGVIARQTLKFLHPYELRRIVYCPNMEDSEADDLDIKLTPLSEVFRHGDVVSIHTPHMRETEGLIKGEHIASMKQGATLVNTARGAIIRQDEMVEVLRQRSDLTAVLDVCDLEPLPAGAELLALPNVVVTPHISGSHFLECRRMGVYMLEELKRYLAGEPLRWQITEKMNAIMA